MPHVLTNYHIKLLAALLMVIDHVGAVLLPDLEILRMVGRLSFPLFAWLLVQGEAHTHKVGKYALRLLGLGLISQPIYALTFQVDTPNILFTLLLGLVCLRLDRTFPDWMPFFWVGGIVIATLTNLEYGGYGIALIALIRYFKPHWLWWAIWIGLHLLIGVALPIVGSAQFLAGFAVLIFGMANQQRGPQARWFYWFYPLHLLILVLISLALQNRLPWLNSL